MMPDQELTPKENVNLFCDKCKNFVKAIPKKVKDDATKPLSVFCSRCLCYVPVKIVQYDLDTAQYKSHDEEPMVTKTVTLPSDLFYSVDTTGRIYCNLCESSIDDPHTNMEKHIFEHDQDDYSKTIISYYREAI